MKIKKEEANIFFALCYYFVCVAIDQRNHCFGSSIFVLSILFLSLISFERSPTSLSRSLFGLGPAPISNQKTSFIGTEYKKARMRYLGSTRGLFRPRSSHLRSDEYQKQLHGRYCRLRMLGPRCRPLMLNHESGRRCFALFEGAGAYASRVTKPRSSSHACPFGPSRQSLAVHSAVLHPSSPSGLARSKPKPRTLAARMA